MLQRLPQAPQARGSLPTERIKSLICDLIDSLGFEELRAENEELKAELQRKAPSAVKSLQNLAVRSESDPYTARTFEDEEAGDVQSTIHLAPALTSQPGSTDSHGDGDFSTTLSVINEEPYPVYESGSSNEQPSKNEQPRFEFPLDGTVAQERSQVDIVVPKTAQHQASTAVHRPGSGTSASAGSGQHLSDTGTFASAASGQRVLFSDTNSSQHVQFSDIDGSPRSHPVPGESSSGTLQKPVSPAVRQRKGVSGHGLDSSSVEVGRVGSMLNRFSLDSRLSSISRVSADTGKMTGMLSDEKGFHSGDHGDKRSMKSLASDGDRGLEGLCMAVRALSIGSKASAASKASSDGTASSDTLPAVTQSVGNIKDFFCPRESTDTQSRVSSNNSLLSTLPGMVRIKSRVSSVGGGLFSVSTENIDNADIQNHIAERFPVWWNPSKAVLQEMKRNRQMEHRISLRFRTKLAEHKSLVFSPVSPLRLSWDLVCYLCILYDLWAIPFELGFCYNIDKPFVMKILEWMIFAIFSLDIVLNFNTAFVSNDTLIFDRKWIVCHYFKFWFWIDVIATIPVAEVYQGSTRAHGILRWLRIFKALRTLRFIKLLQSLSAVQTLQTTLSQSKLFNTCMLNSMLLVRASATLAFILWIGHALCCVWQWLRSDAVHPTSFQEAVWTYGLAYYSMYLVLVDGDRLLAVNPSTRLFVMFTSTIHHVIDVVLVAYFVFATWMLFGENAQVARMHNRTMQYMKRHQLSFKTRVQVMFHLQQVQNAQVAQKDFVSLMTSDLPTELQKKIAHELWGDKLMTLGLVQLITTWDDAFPNELATHCSEEVLSSKTVLFNEDDLSFAAYHIIYGDMVVTCCLVEEPTKFWKGMWLGESALVSPSFRRGLMACAASLVSVMCVPAQSFHDILTELGIQEEFALWVKEELWTGLCGRCGMLGDHFSDQCPLLETSDQSTDILDGVMSTRELREYLRLYRADHLLPHLEEIGIHNLSDLEQQDEATLKRMLTHPSLGFPSDEIGLLSRQKVAAFRDDVLQGTESVINRTEVSITEHLVFLSHYKLEAGTEAALMRSELERLIEDNPTFDGYRGDVPVFLDSENLTNLKELQIHLENSHCIVLLLTEKVLSRVWCLVELVCAVRVGIPIMLVLVDKVGNSFHFPDEKFYQDLAAGVMIDKEAEQVLVDHGIQLDELESAIRAVFKSIAVPYSPHKSLSVRKAQLQTLVHQIKTRPEMRRTGAELKKTLSKSGSCSSLTKQKQLVEEAAAFVKAAQGSQRNRNLLTKDRGDSVRSSGIASAVGTASQ